MGFLNKLKDVLFEPIDEGETSERENKRETVVDTKKPIAEKIEPQRKEDVEELHEMPKAEVKPDVHEDHIDSINERDLFKSDNTFPFPDFDETEFERMSRVQKVNPTTNVLEYEKKKKIEKKYDYGRYERTDRAEVVEKKKFKPSPIISPVYGILHEDYKPEDIQDKTDYNANLDFNSVRKKAFESVLKEEEKEEPTTTFYEETVTVKLKEPEIEREQKVKTIDELLEDTDEFEKIKIVEEKPKVEYDKIEEELEEIKPTLDVKEKTETEKVEDDDTLENDLFDLIDSMYDNREDGEL